MRLCKLPLPHMCLMFFFSVSLSLLFLFSHHLPCSLFCGFCSQQFFHSLSVLVWKFSVTRRGKIFCLWSCLALVLIDSRLFRNLKETNFACLLLLAKWFVDEKTGNKTVCGILNFFNISKVITQTIRIFFKIRMSLHKICYISKSKLSFKNRIPGFLALK